MRGFSGEFSPRPSPRLGRARELAQFEPLPKIWLHRRRMGVAPVSPKAVIKSPHSRHWRKVIGTRLVPSRSTSVHRDKEESIYVSRTTHPLRVETTRAPSAKRLAVYRRYDTGECFKINGNLKYVMTTALILTFSPGRRNSIRKPFI